jgi:hypothetical protein
MGYLHGVDEQPGPFEMDMEDGGARKSDIKYDDIQANGVKNGTA